MNETTSLHYGETAQTPGHPNEALRMEVQQRSVLTMNLLQIQFTILHFRLLLHNNMTPFNSQ